MKFFVRSVPVYTPLEYILISVLGVAPVNTLHTPTVLVTDGAIVIVDIERSLLESLVALNADLSIKLRR